MRQVCIYGMPAQRESDTRYVRTVDGRFWEPCGQPAVDYIVVPGHNLGDEQDRLWYCAEHFDEINKDGTRRWVSVGF